MAKIKFKCNIEGCKGTEEVRSFNIGTKKFITLDCGHMSSEDLLKHVEIDIVSRSGKTLLPYQKVAIEQLEKSNGRSLLAYEQGLGKTVIAANFLWSRLAEVSPILWITKASLTRQAFQELVDWGNFVPQLISKSNEQIIPGFNLYIVSYEILARNKYVQDHTFTTAVIDECQNIKTQTAKRTNAARKVAIKAKYVLPMSGTPVKNHAGEYFVVLNMIRPEKFPTYNGFLSKWCDYYSTGYGYKVGGIARHNLDNWNSYTSEFIFRKTREEVLPDLPKIFRKNQFFDLSEEVEGQYAKLQEEFNEEYEKTGGKVTMGSNLLSYLSMMRQLTGISKAKECIDWIRSFIEENIDNDKKIVIFRHHKKADLILTEGLKDLAKEYGFNAPLRFEGGIDGEAASRIIAEFKDDPKNRILIASQLAAGEGINLQFCEDAVMLERQWNPANEEQCEGRFSRIGSVASSISVTYMLAIGTIDEWFTELVEKKRSYIGSTLDGKDIKWEESNMLQELADLVYAKGKKKWTM